MDSNQQTATPVRNGTYQSALAANSRDLSIDEQKKLSQPLPKLLGLSAEDEAFLNMVVAKIDTKEIDLLRPSSLLNQPVYNALTQLQQGKADYDSVNLLSTLRTIYGLWKTNPTATYQIENMVHSVRLTKERLEEISGDVYII